MALAVVVGTLVGTPRCFHEFFTRKQLSAVQCATVKVEHSLEESQQRSYSYSYKVPNKRDYFFYHLMLELVSKELNHFGVIADLFRQIGGHSSRFVLFCSF